MREKTQKAFSNILDTMTGADGGIRFLNYKILIDEFDERASKGDAAAQDIIDIMERFSRMIDVAQQLAAEARDGRTKTED